MVMGEEFKEFRSSGVQEFRSSGSRFRHNCNTKEAAVGF